jgi:hypothetical protein
MPGDDNYPDIGGGMSNIFIVGCPRSGKTLLQEMLAFHNDFAWFSQYYRKFRSFPEVTFLNRIYDVPFIGNFMASMDKKKILPRPVEMRKDYNSTLSEIGSLDQEDVIEKDTIDLRLIFQRQHKIQKKKRFITDYGRPARMLYFKEIFPESQFIHVVKNGRNVIASLLTERPEWFTENTDLYAFCKTVPEEYNEILLSYKRTKNYGMVLAALRWKIAIIEIEKQKLKLPKNSYLEIKYEDLIKNKFATVQKCLDFLNLKWTKRLKLVIEHKNLYHENLWESFFDIEQKKIIEKVLNMSEKKHKRPSF